MKLVRVFFSLLVAMSALSWSSGANAQAVTCPYINANQCVSWMFPDWQIANGTRGYVSQVWVFRGFVAGAQRTINIQIPPDGFASANLWLEGQPYGTFPAQLISAQNFYGTLGSGAAQMTFNLMVDGSAYQVTLSETPDSINSGNVCFSIAGAGSYCRYYTGGRM